MKWYAVQTYSTYEDKAKKGIETSVKNAGIEAQLGEILVPTEQVVEVKNGEKVPRSKKLLPGYILVQMELNDAMWHAIKKTSYITGFVGNDRTPPPVPPGEVERLRGQIEAGQNAARPVASFEVHDQVRVIDGPFKNFTGKVEEVNAEKAKVRVLVSIFGRATPLELDFTQVEVVTG
jgi:transcriptional antiterminator NusG